MLGYEVRFTTPRGINIGISADFIATYIKDESLFPVYIGHIERAGFFHSFYSFVAFLFVGCGFLDIKYNFLASVCVFFFCYTYGTVRCYRRDNLAYLISNFLCEIYILLSRYRLNYVLILILAIFSKSFLLVFSFFIAKTIGFLCRLFVAEKILFEIYKKRYNLFLSAVDVFALKAFRIYINDSFYENIFSLYSRWLKDKDVPQ